MNRTDFANLISLCRNLELITLPRIRRLWTELIVIKRTNDRIENGGSLCEYKVNIPAVDMQSDEAVKPREILVSVGDGSANSRQEVHLEWQLLVNILRGCLKTGILCCWESARRVGLNNGKWGLAQRKRWLGFSGGCWGEG